MDHNLWFIEWLNVVNVNNSTSSGFLDSSVAVYGVRGMYVISVGSVCTNPDEFILVPIVHSPLLLLEYILLCLAFEIRFSPE